MTTETVVDALEGDIADDAPGSPVRIRRLLKQAYEAVVDACDEGYPPDYEAAGQPLADALSILRGAP